MLIEDLRDSLLSIDLNIKGDLKDISMPYKDCDDFGAILSDLVAFYRNRALLKYLVDADLDAFFEDLMRSSLTYITLLQAYNHKMDVHKEDGVDASSYQPLECAVAANNFDTAKEIGLLMPKEADIYDSEEGLAYTTMLRNLISGDQQMIMEAYEKFEGSCKGIDRFDHVIKIINGLIVSKVDQFNEGLFEYLESFSEIEPDEAEEMDPGEEYIRIEALAYIQIAKRNDMPLKIIHRMIPSELQDAILVAPKTEYPRWPG